MPFDPGLKIGDEINNKQLSELFKCDNMRGMRRSHTTGTLVLVADHTKDIYNDMWKGNIMHYTGMGKHGDQELKDQNRTLYESDTNGVEVFLFEVFREKVYTYKGQVKLAGKPYQDKQKDEEGRVRKVWIFPIAPIESLEKDKKTNKDEKVYIPLFEREIRQQKSSGLVEPKLSTSKLYNRDEILRDNVKIIANGKCQLCGNDAPFIDPYGAPYLEEHHIVKVADGGSDTMDNVVALCPNCHRKMHSLNDENDRHILEKAAKHNEEEYQKRVSRLLSKMPT